MYGRLRPEVRQEKIDRLKKGNMLWHKLTQKKDISRGDGECPMANVRKRWENSWWRAQKKGRHKPARFVQSW